MKLYEMKKKYIYSSEIGILQYFYKITLYFVKNQF